ncbi:tetraacyldisaccharide 4'-kinase [Marinicaulis flavus]|uniref:Tetraacyldisaccharide 4'-kinase n=2 Tax=Hyphococcus luteus TaxID=2058213 RepID=A0A2S7K447_9PROT|nr:tetraacyldisaccharide 4'-kinase [Marinicaulis flavus]
MREPWFWRTDTPTARALAALLTPAAWIYQAGHRLRWAMTKPAKASLPVICVGNATLGGAGKTPFAILAAALLREAGVAPVFLTRGYGGALGGPLTVDPAKHTAYSVGDEALLLARHGPVIVSRDRPAGARRAAKTGAQVIIMDDGFQNPSLAKDLSILLIGEEDAQTNGALFPAGPYRESPSRAKARADIVVAVKAGPSEKPDGADMAAWLEAEGAPAPERVIAFAGIGRPEKFFRTLEEAGFTLARRIAFPDHHPFTEIELEHLMKDAARQKARLICTEKDHVRLPPAFREDILALPVAMQVSDREALKQRLAGLIKSPGEEGGQS